MTSTKSLCLAVLMLTACGGSTSGGTATCDGGAACGGAGGTGASGGTAASGGFGGGPFTGGSGGTVTGGFGGIAGAAPGTAKPPDPDPGAPVAAGTTPTTLAVYRLSLGDLDPSGTPDYNAWKKLGYDIDGIWSTKNDVAHCKPQQGATKSSVQTDGDGGLDNSFGANLLPIMGSLTANPSDAMNQSIQAGEMTLLFHFANLAAQPPSQNGISAAFFNGSKTSLVPQWNGSDVWPVTAESVNGGSIASPKVAFPSSYLVNGAWVASATPVPGPIELALVSLFPFPLSIRHLRVSMQVSGSGSAATAHSGIISGVLDTEEFVAGMKKVAGSFDPNLCEGATFESIAQQIRAASDIMLDGTNGDPSKSCDGITIGLGFEARAVSLGPVAAPVTPTPDPCIN